MQPFWSSYKLPLWLILAAWVGDHLKHTLRNEEEKVHSSQPSMSLGTQQHFLSAWFISGHILHFDDLNIITFQISSSPCTLTLAHPHTPRALEFLACTSHFWSNPQPYPIIFSCPVQAREEVARRGERRWNQANKWLSFILDFCDCVPSTYQGKEHIVLEWQVLLVCRKHNFLCFWTLDTARGSGCLVELSVYIYNFIFSLPQICQVF